MRINGVDVAPEIVLSNGCTVSFRQACVRSPESRFLFGQEAADGGSADLKLACDLGFADSLPK